VTLFFACHVLTCNFSFISKGARDTTLALDQRKRNLENQFSLLQEQLKKAEFLGKEPVIKEIKASLHQTKEELSQVLESLSKKQIPLKTASNSSQTASYTKQSYPVSPSLSLSPSSQNQNQNPSLIQPASFSSAISNPQNSTTISEDTNIFHPNTQSLSSSPFSSTLSSEEDDTFFSFITTVDSEDHFHSNISREKTSKEELLACSGTESSSQLSVSSQRRRAQTDSSTMNKKEGNFPKQGLLVNLVEDYMEKKGESSVQTTSSTSQPLNETNNNINTQAPILRSRASTDGNLKTLNNLNNNGTNNNNNNGGFLSNALEVSKKYLGQYLSPTSVSTNNNTSNNNNNNNNYFVEFEVIQINWYWRRKIIFYFFIFYFIKNLFLFF
jgi:hypothetical protein